MADDSSPQELQQAFVTFNALSTQLSGQFETLQAEVEQLSTELAVRNDALQAELAEKAALAQRVSALLAALPAGVLELDAQARITAQNAAAQLLLGADVTGCLWPEVAVQTLAPTVVPDEWTLLAQPDKRLAIAVSHLPANGRILVLTDISNSVALQMQLAQHKKLAALGEMAAGLAHQLRTPLSSAILYASHLKDANLPAAQREKFADKVGTQLANLEQLIADLLRFVRGGESGPIEPFDAALVQHEAMQSVLPRYVEKGVDLQLSTAAAPMPLLGNRTALIGAMANLLENALLFSPVGSSVHFVLEPMQDEAVLTIRDAGLGVSASVQDRLFEPFVTTRPDGNGLGLAIVSSVASAHGGSVVLLPSEIGAVFRVSIPLTHHPV